jgi:hypothetical protein
VESATSIAKEVTAVVSESKSGIFIIPKTTDTGKLRDEQRQKQAGHLVRTMLKAYDLEDLRALCFDFGIDYDSIDGDTKKNKIISFIMHFYKNDTLQIITEFLEGDREKWNWRVEKSPAD